MEFKIGQLVHSLFKAKRYNLGIILGGPIITQTNKYQYAQKKVYYRVYWVKDGTITKTQNVWLLAYSKEEGEAI